MNETPAPTTPQRPPGPAEPLAHIAPPGVLLAVFAALVVLTAITVAISYFDFGAINLMVAMSVATAKATLVALYFMHLRYDSLFNTVIFLIGVAFIGLFLVITMFDSVQYHPDVEIYQQTTQ